MLYLIQHVTATNISPLAYTENKDLADSYAMNLFKTKLPEFARYPFWSEGQAPLGYEVIEVNSDLSTSKWLKNLDKGIL